MKIFGKNEESRSLFFHLLLLTLFFVFFEISFFFQSIHVYLNDFNLVARKLDIPLAILPGVLYFILVQILVHGLALLLVFGFSLAIARFFKFSTQNLERAGLVLWGLGLLWVLLANQYYYPNSKFAYLSRFIIADQLNGVLLVFLSCFWFVVIFITAYISFSLFCNSFALRKRSLRGAFCATKQSTWIASSHKTLLAMTAGVGLFLSGWIFYSYSTQVKDAATEQRPNIILIGIDSLRPDFLGYRGSSLLTQAIDAFLNQSTVFMNSFTPLARTYPSWVGILSGKYPKEMGVRFNLANQSPYPKEQLLSVILQKQGYHTLYATDEARFSNIDQRFGFDELVTPLMGLNDFLLGSFNDFPLSNLLINTPAGKYLFPYSYANRPVYVTYEPNSFLNRLRPYLRYSRHQPLFLAVHFCLTHYPYLWASYPVQTNRSNLQFYEDAIVRVDQQFGDFMQLLAQEQVLNHAIVVLLSDHGEALELPGDRITTAEGYLSQKGHSRRVPRFYPPSADIEAVNQSAGHGTDVLGLTQYRSLLAFKLYGLQRQYAKKINYPTILLDIKPSILDFLHLSSQSSGLSLKPAITQSTYVLPSQRLIYLESDFSPEAIRSVHPETRNLIFEGIEYYRVDPKSMRIFVKENMEQLILSSKQYALIEGDWVLALYPQSGGKRMPVLVQLSTGKWTTDLSLAFAQHSPAKNMLYTLQKFYGLDLYSH